jgi:hypothetical protein
VSLLPAEPCWMVVLGDGGLRSRIVEAVETVEVVWYNEKQSGFCC